MKTLPCLSLALGLMAATPMSPASATGPGHDPATSLRLLPPANRLVGLWRTDIYASPAACTPGGPRAPLIGHNTMTFEAGGTLVENPQVTPPGIPGFPQLRTFGLGKWSFDLRTGKYKVLVRFDWYASSDGAYLGYQVIDRTILLSNDRNRAHGPITSTRYAPDGSFVAKLCGEAISTRL